MAREPMSREVEQVLLDAEKDGLTVHWSACSRCGFTRDEHIGPGRRCPGPRLEDGDPPPPRPPVFVSGPHWSVCAACGRYRWDHRGAVMACPR